MAPPRGSLDIHRLYIKNLLVGKNKAEDYQSWYVALSGGRLQRLFKF